VRRRQGAGRLVAQIRLSLRRTPSLALLDVFSDALVHHAGSIPRRLFFPAWIQRFFLFKGVYVGNLSPLRRRQDWMAEQVGGAFWIENYAALTEPVLLHFSRFLTVYSQRT